MRDALDTLHDLLGPAARRAEPLARHASARIGGPADLFVVARSQAELVQAVDGAVQVGVPWTLLGSASNLLIADEGVEGLVIKVATRGVRLARAPGGEMVYAQAEAGTMLASLARQTAEQGLAGLEWAVNVPGTAGAAVVNNSGAFGSVTDEHLVSALLYEPGGGLQTLGPRELGLAYRTSAVKRGELPGVVLSATYWLVPSDPVRLRERMRAIQRQRRTTQPDGYSLGSTFMNPPDDVAGRLIEAAGLKRWRRGAAEISSVHANFVVNRGGASARDVLRVVQDVQGEVWRRFGVWLHPEIQLVGRWSEVERRALAGPVEVVA